MCTFGRYLVGIVANNGNMTADAASKGAHFVQLCSQRKVPLVFLQNTTPEATEVMSPQAGPCDHCSNFCISISLSQRHEALGMYNNVEFSAAHMGIQLRHEARLMAAVACAQVPKLTVVVGNSFGPSNFMMVSSASQRHGFLQLVVLW